MSYVDENGNIVPVPPSQHGQEQDTITKAYKERRPITFLAAFGLVVITAGAAGGIAYDLVVNGRSESLTQLGTLATLGLGGLLALAGARGSNGGS